MTPAEKPAMRGHSGLPDVFGGRPEDSRNLSIPQRRSHLYQLEAQSLAGSSQHAALALAHHFGRVQ